MPWIREHVRQFGIGAVLAAIVIIVAAALILRAMGILAGKPKVITDHIELPHTAAITGTEGRFIEKSDAYPVPLVPKSESDRVIVTDAVLTAKESYLTAKKEAQKWSPDAKLVFVKSLGSVMLDGRSSYWQIGFGSKRKKSGYEVIIHGGEIVEAKTVVSKVYGYDEPKTFYDSKDAIDTIRTLPQFDAATISRVILRYDTDGRVWSYAVTSSIGTSVIPIK